VHRCLLSMRRFYEYTVITQIDSGECGKSACEVAKNFPPGLWQNFFLTYCSMLRTFFERKGLTNKATNWLNRVGPNAGWRGPRSPWSRSHAGALFLSPSRSRRRERKPRRPSRKHPGSTLTSSTCVRIGIACPSPTRSLQNRAALHAMR